MDHDDARTDVVLAGAAAVFGGAVRSFMVQVPGYPRVGLAAVLLDLVWILVLTALVPMLLARHRGDGWAAFGLGRGPRPLGPRRRGLLAGLPFAVVVVGAGWLLTPVAWPLGRLRGPLVAGDLAGVALAATWVAALTVGAFGLLAFLTTRGQQFSRSPQVLLRGTLRTIGMGSAGVALVAGLVRAVSGRSVLHPIVLAVALAILVLLADRLLDANTRVHRSAVLAPATVVAVGHLFSTGGLWRGDLVTALYAGGLAVGVTVVIASLTVTRRAVHAGIVLLVAVHWIPNCLSPLTFELGAC